MELQRVKGKVAIVTGGAGGIGSATVRRMVAEGARVVVADIELARAKTVASELGDKAFAVEFDAGNEESIRNMIETSVRHFGRLDILHNNAAYTDGEFQRLDTTAPATPVAVWDKTLDINLKGYFLASKYAIPHMVKGGGGAIVMTASGSGLHGDLVRLAYGASKAGVISLTKSIATQHGLQGIRCNAIAPGVILTQAMKDAAPELLTIIKQHILTQRFGEPDDIAALAVYLASDEAGYITGQTISCDGGMNAHAPFTHDLYAFMKEKGWV